MRLYHIYIYIKTCSKVSTTSSTLFQVFMKTYVIRKCEGMKHFQHHRKLQMEVPICWTSVMKKLKPIHNLTL